MSATPSSPTGPALAGKPPPEKKEAAPAKEAAKSSGEHKESATPDATPQESALTTLCKAWMSCGPTDRRLFLADVRAGCPNLWRAVDREACAGRVQ